MHRLLRHLRKRFQGTYRDIQPEDIFLDSENLAGLDHDRFEGHIETPMKSVTFWVLKIVIVLVVCSFGFRLWGLQVTKGEEFRDLSENNRLSHDLIFANRGVIYDRNRVPLAENAIKEGNEEYPDRVYAPISGLSHVLGYVKYPQKDRAGFYYAENFQGISGVEKVYNDSLTGHNGLKISETDARGNKLSENTIEKPLDGQDLILSLDARVTEEMYRAISGVAEEHGFQGGGGAIMDVVTGEILALTSYPEYDPNILTKGEDNSEIKRLLESKDVPLLNRVVGGLYTPGSIVKPIVALGALEEGVIDPMKEILSTGSISVPNPYDASNPTIFRDWKAHGWVNMRDAIALSSDVYFYEVGGGYPGQRGLGINNIDKYFSMFGMEEKTGIDLPGESAGTIASIAWKEKNFPGDAWRLGNTYHTAIGQYGTQVTPIEALRWVGAIANSGTLLVPSVLKGGRKPDERIHRHIEIPESSWRIIREGMRQGVAGRGAVNSLNSPDVKIAAKTGTAELGSRKDFVNSWVTGFFPYEHPRYAFVVFMERGPVANLVGATAVMRRIIDWMALYTPEYLE